MSQTQAILDHLENHGSITPIEALDLYGCFRLAARIYDLRRAGVEITEENVSRPDGKTWARYSLARQPRVQMEMDYAQLKGMTK